MMRRRLFHSLVPVVLSLVLPLAIPGAAFGRPAASGRADPALAARAGLAWNPEEAGPARPLMTLAALYDLSDIVGVWEFNILASGPGAPWWARRTVTVAPDGSFSATGTESGGGAVDPVNGVFGLSPGGILTTSLSPTHRSVLDAGKSVLAGTDTWADGTTELGVGTRMAGTYTLSDLVGTWEVNSLASGPGAPWWERARATVTPDGGFRATTSYADGGVDSVSGTLTISPDGVVSIVGLPTIRGALDAGRTVLVMTDTWTGHEAGTTELKVWTKMAAPGTYQLADLEGTWEFNVLASGAGAPWWGRVTVTVASDGGFSGSMTDSEGGSGTDTGVVGISPEGVFTISMSSIARGVLDAGKSVLVMTNTWPDGTAELSVGTKVLTGVTAFNRWMGDYLPLRLGMAWTYQNEYPPGDTYTETVFESLLHEGTPALKYGSPAEYRIVDKRGRVVTVYAFYENGTLNDLSRNLVLGAFGDGSVFDVCAGGSCDSSLIRTWESIDPTLRAAYGLGAYDDLVMIASYDRNLAPNVRNVLAQSNLQAGVTPPAGAVTGLEWYQRDLGQVAIADVEAADGTLKSFHKLIQATAVEGPRDRPLASGLGPPVPNPARGATVVSYVIAQAGPVRLAVYDVSGRLVRLLVDGERVAGAESLIWDGADESGIRQGAGVYFVRLAAPGLRQTRRLALLR